MSAAFLITAFTTIGLLAVGFYVVRDRAERRAEGRRLPVVD